MSGGTEYAEALVRAEAEIARLRRELERRAGAASPAPRERPVSLTVECSACGSDNAVTIDLPAASVLEARTDGVARAAPRDEDPVRRALIAMGERWHACNKGRAPSEAENERRKCARELLRFARALAPPSPPSGPARCVALDEYPRCSQPPVPGSNLCWAHGGDMFGKPPPSGPDSGSNEEG